MCWVVISAVLEIREGGKAQPNPSKISSSTTEPHLLQKLASQEMLPGCLQQPPCPSPNFLVVLSAHRGEDPRLGSPDSFPATEVNDFIPRFFHLLPHYPCVIPRAAGLKSSPAPLGAKVAPTGTQPSHCTLRGDHSQEAAVTFPVLSRNIHFYLGMVSHLSLNARSVLELIRQQSSLAGLLMAPN